MIFDYVDLIYNYDDPLHQVVFKELNHTLRTSFKHLSLEQQFFIKEIIINEKSLTHVALFLQLSQEEVEQKLKESLAIFCCFFQNTYLNC